MRRDEMDVTVNGRRHRLDGPLPLERLLAELKVQVHTGIAVLRNGDVVRKSDWPGTTVQPDDQLEIVRATVGG